jgi:hypothetical protein
VTDLTFAQSSRRNYTAPVLIAVVLLAAIGAFVQHHLSGHAITAGITHAEVFPIRVALNQPQQQAMSFKVLSDKPASQDEGIYILAKVHIEDHLTDPLFLKDFHATLDTPQGQYRASAIEQGDLPAVTSAFPELIPKLATPLLRESKIAPGQSADGTVILQFPVLQSTWDTGQSAEITVDFYHQPSIRIQIPKP